MTVVWIVIAIVVVLFLVVTAWRLAAKRRTGHLQGRFGAEYERTLESEGSRRRAESELEAREDQREKLDIRPLPQASRERYLESWRHVQAQFVDEPKLAVAGAESLIQSVMRERGYPVEDFDQRAAVISVDHPDVVEHYREGARLANAGAEDGDQTESLRQGMQHYRTLFEQLVEVDADQPLGRDDGQTQTAERERTVR